jgi:hypothetical protein
MQLKHLDEFADKNYILKTQGRECTHKYTPKYYTNKIYMAWTYTHAKRKPRTKKHSKLTNCLITDLTNESKTRWTKADSKNTEGRIKARKENPSQNKPICMANKKYFPSKSVNLQTMTKQNNTQN